MVLGIRRGGEVLVSLRRSRRVVEEECVTLMSCCPRIFLKVWRGRSGRVGRRRGRSLEPVESLLRSGRGEVSAACFVHDSTYTLIMQTRLPDCNSVCRCCGEQRLLALLVRDLITPFFAELVMEEEYSV